MKNDIKRPDAKEEIFQDGLRFIRFSTDPPTYIGDDSDLFGKIFSYYFCPHGCDRLVSNAGWARRNHARKYHPKVVRE